MVPESRRRRLIPWGGGALLPLVCGCGQIASDLGRSVDRMFEALELLFLGIVLGGAVVELILLALAARSLWQLRVPRLLLAAATVVIGYQHVKLVVLIVRSGLEQQQPLTVEELLICLALMLPLATLLLLLFGALRERLPARLRAPHIIVAAAAAIAALCGGAGARLLQGSFVQFEPVPIPAGVVTESIAASKSHGCSLTATGAALCWGSNREGQLGTGKLLRRGLPPLMVAGLEGASALIVEDDYSCALRRGQVLCWGQNERDRFGRDFPEQALVPTPVSGLDDVVELGSQGWPLWARKRSGLLIRMPGRQHRSDQPHEPDIVPSDTLQTVVARDFWCARRTLGAVSCRCEEGGLFPVRTRPIATLAAVGSFLCGLRADGRLACADPNALKRSRDTKLYACQQPQRAEAMARHLAWRYRNPDAPPLPPPELDHSCELQLDQAEGADAVPPLQEIPGIEDATALAGNGTQLCVATRSQGVRCAENDYHSGALPEFTEILTEAPGQPLPVFTSSQLSCVLPDPGHLFCWRGPVGPAAQQILNRMKPRSRVQFQE